MDDQSLDFGSFRIVEFETDEGRHSLAGCSLPEADEKKARHGRAFLQTTIRSTGDLHQMPGAFDRASPVGPLDVSFVADDGFDHPVSTFQYAESADQIDLGPHRNSRAASIEQAAKSGDQGRSSEQGMIALRIEQTQAVLQLAQVLGLRKERLDPTIFLSRQVVIDGIQ
jgi:hypothetical protein